MTSQSILRFFTQHRDELVELLRELVGLEVPTGDREASARFAARYASLLRECGVECRVEDSPAGTHLVGDWPPGKRKSDAGPDVTFVVHSDTVWPEGETVRRPPEIRDGCLYGPGVYDMRAGLMLAVAFFRFLHREKLSTGRSFRVFVCADEENGSPEGRKAMEREVARETVALVLEPPALNGGMKLRRKGVGIYALRLRGTAAHAGVRPQDGASAIDALAGLIGEVNNLRDPSRGITLNVGTVRGGTASNVIADAAEMSIDLRFLEPEDGDRVDRAIRSLRPGDRRVSVELEGGIVFPPMNPDARTLELAQRAIEMARDFDLELSVESTGGGSDGSLLASRGIATLDGLGVEGDGAHALHEHVIVDRIPQRAAFLSRLALEI